MPERILVTAGPTLSRVAIAARLPLAEVVPPIAHGDVYRYQLADGDTLAIVDGLFMQVASVRHRELLELLDRGVRVLGAASMGALRAAELHPYGMVGIGGVYSAFVRGDLDGDDEVAVVHGLAEDGYPVFTDALVNLRATLAGVAGHGLITAAEHDLVLAAAKGRSFERRAAPEVLRDLVSAGRLTADRAATLRGVLREGWVDVKRADALELLTALAGATIAQGTPSMRPRAAQRSYFTHRWALAHTPPVDGVASARLLVTAAVVCEDFADWRHGQLLEVAAAMHAAATGVRSQGSDPLTSLALSIGCDVEGLHRLSVQAGVSSAALVSYAATLASADAAIGATSAGPVAAPLAGAARRAALERVAVTHAELVGLTGAGVPLPDELVRRVLGEGWDLSCAQATTAAVVTRTFLRSPGVPLDDWLLTPLRLSGQLPALRAIIGDAGTAVRRFHLEVPGATLQGLRVEVVLDWLGTRWARPVDAELSRRGLLGTDLRAAAGPLVLLDRLVTVPSLRLTSAMPPISTAAAMAPSRQRRSGRARFVV